MNPLGGSGAIPVPPFSLLLTDTNMNLPPLIPPSACSANGPTATCTPALLRTAEQGNPTPIAGAKASVLLDFNPGFDDGHLTIEAASQGAEANGLFAEVTGPISWHLTSASLFGNLIQITPGSRSRLIVTSSNPVFAGTYYHAGNYTNTTRPYWKKVDSVDTVILAFPFPDSVSSGTWQFFKNDVAYFTSLSVTYDLAFQPGSLTFSPLPIAGASTLSLVEAASDIHQIINAINTSASLMGIVVASTDSPSPTAPVVEILSVPLTGGIDGHAGEYPVAIGQFCRVGPYTLDPPRTEPFDWFIGETMTSWRQVFD